MLWVRFYAGCEVLVVDGFGVCVGKCAYIKTSAASRRGEKIKRLLSQGLRRWCGARNSPPRTPPAMLDACKVRVMMFRSSVRPCGLHCADSCIKSRMAGDCSSRRLISASVSCFTFVLTIQVQRCRVSGYSEAETGLCFWTAVSMLGHSMIWSDEST